MTAPIGGIGEALRGAAPLQDPATGIRRGAPSGAPGIDGIAPIEVPVLRGSEAPSFGDTLNAMLTQVSDLNATSRDYVQAFLRGEPVELHQVMAAAEESGIAIELLIQVRNKFLEAYRTVMNMTT